MAKILLEGHRGDRKHAPENTMLSFQSAVKYGVDGIETDIHMSRDGVLFCMHDHKVDRTTNGTGGTHTLTWAEIRALDAGSWYGAEFAGTRVPSLEELIAWLKQTPDLHINWEMKDFPEIEGEEFSLRSARKLVEAIEEAGLSGRSMLNSFSSEVLEYAYEISGGRMLIHGHGVPPASHMRGTAKRAIGDYWDWACLRSEQGNAAAPEIFDACRRLGIHPCACVADTPQAVQTALERGCEMFISNDPETCAGILRELGER